MNKLKQLQEKLAKAQADQKQVWEQAGPDIDFSKVTCISGTDLEKCATVRKMNDDAASIQKEIEGCLAVEKMRSDFEAREGKVAPVKHPQPNSERNEEEKHASLGELFIKSGAHLKENWNKDAEIKTAFTTAAGWAAPTIRTGRVVLDEQRPVQVMDIVPPEQTDAQAIVYMEETTFTNNAAEATESTGAYGEAALALTERTSTVRKVAVFLPVTEEQLEDVAQATSYVNNRLTFMVRQRLDQQIVRGDGIAPNLTGTLNVSGIQTQSGAGITIPDAFFKAMIKVRATGRAIPSHLLIHSTDWQTVRLLKTNDGNYVWGHPSVNGPETMWGLPVVVTEAFSASGTGIVGDYRGFSGLAEKKGMTVKVTDSHSDYFIYGKLAISATLRVALTHYRPAAFCEVTVLGT